MTFPTSAPAADQVAQAARCALALRALLPGAPMAIATCRSEVGRPPRTVDAVERAAALLASQGSAAGGGGERSIALDETTASLLGPRFEVAGGWLAGTRAVPAVRPLLGRVTPMVGREWEIGSIRSMFTACVEEQEPRAILVTGAAGMGKSRLGHEAVAVLRDLCPEVQVWRGQGDPLRSGSALGVLGQLVRSAAGVGESEPIEARWRTFAEHVAAWVPATTAEILGEVAGVPFLDERSASLRAAWQDPRIMSDQIRAAWEALVAGASAAAPLLVVLEDAQWADAATMRLLGGALVGLERRPWMVLALGRPEVYAAFPRLWQAHVPQEIRLGPLTRRAGERLVRLVLQDAATETVQRLVERADGNPFYLEELIRAVAEGLAVTTEGARGVLPETVLAMVEARLAGLHPGTRRILRAASVFGEVFWTGGVTALLGSSAPPDGWIDDLVGRELVRVRARSRLSGERELCFRHALLCEGVYATLTEGDRVLGHGLAGAWLERHGETDAMALALHFDAAGDEARAAHFYLAAAAQAPPLSGERAGDHVEDGAGPRLAGHRLRF